LADTITIRRMAPTDVDQVVEIELRSFPTPWSREAYLNELRNPSAYYMVGEFEDRIVSYCGAWVVMDECHITTIAVHPRYRGRAFGAQTLYALLDEARKRGANRATLEVRPSNDPAQTLYAKFQFFPAARRKGYYADTREDAVVMWLNDIEAALADPAITPFKPKGCLDEVSAV